MTPRSSQRRPAASETESPGDVPPTWLALGGSNGQLDWDAVFERRAPVELEIGCGNGRHLAPAAMAHPERNFLGIELARKYALLAARRLEKLRLRNAMAGHAEAGEFLERRVAAGSLSAVHIYFSDPWPKRKHAARRLFRPGFLDLLARVAAPEAPVRIKTDVDWYYAAIVSLFLSHSAFRIREYGEQTGFPDEELAMTGFESKAQRLGRRVFHLLVRRNGGAP